MSFGKEAAAALVFAILYFAMFCYMCFMYATKRYKCKSRFTILFFHTIIRVASQACGVAFGILVWKNVDVFVAYLILGAEGYFSLTIASYHFLKSYEIKSFGRSRLGPKKIPKDVRKKRAFELLGMVPIVMPHRYWKADLLALVDSWLIPANAIIIAGGSMMANVQSRSDMSQDQINKKLNTSKGLRTAGQAIFLLLTCLYIALLANAAKKTRAAGQSMAAVSLYTIVSAMLFARGLFGVLQAAVYSLSYYNPENYDGAEGFTSRFVAIEYVLAVMTEFTAAFLLNVSYWPTRHFKSMEEAEIVEENELQHKSDDREALTRKGTTN